MTAPEDITLGEVLERTLARSSVRAATETLPLGDADGRILRNAVVAGIDVPQQDTAAVDGYAFHHADIAGGSPALPVLGSIKAGHPYDGAASRGNAYRIFTGAPMPTHPGGGPDTVAMEEFCTLHDDGTVTMPGGIRKGSNFRPKGENVRKGETVLEPGTRLGPSEIGLAASVGVVQLEVAEPLAVEVVSTGDEVVEAGSPEGFGQARLHDSNRPMLASLLRGDGHRTIDGGIVADDREALAKTLLDASGRADATVCSGGSSTGEEDHARPAILAAGGEIDFWRLAIKPGRPMAVGWLKDKPVFCLPGNPVASFVCYRLLVMPVLAAMQGAAPRPLVKTPLPAGFSHRHRDGRTEYLRASLAPDDTGRTAIFIHGRAGAGVLSSLTGADGLVEIPADHGHVAPGDLLDFIPLREHAL